MAEIGPRLKLIRQNMGITQRELARELGINQAILSKFERGNMVYASVLLDVLSYFRGHIDVNYLLQPGNGFNLNDERHAFSNHSQFLKPNKISTSLRRKSNNSFTTWPECPGLNKTTKNAAKLHSRSPTAKSAYHNISYAQFLSH